VFAALLASRQPGRKFRVVTFGAPRVGFLNPWLGCLLRGGVEAVEYARAGDIVPELPGAPLFNHPTWPRAIGAPVAGTATAVALFDEIARIGQAICANHSFQRYADDLAARGL